MFDEPIIVEPVKRVVKEYRIESYSEEGIFYKIEIYSDGDITCSCPAIKECKHIKDVKEKIKKQKED